MTNADHLFKRYNLGIGKFSNNEADLEAFISRFEVVAHAYNLPEHLYAIELAKSLEGVFLEVYETLAPESRLIFDDVVEALKKRFGVTRKSYRKRFLQVKCMENENQKDFVIRLEKYFVAWLDKAGSAQTFEGVVEHITADRYYESQSPELSELSAGDKVLVYDLKMNQI